ncbi:MAG: hypothetical protein FK733_16415 [Asgard group archaeon]|nr:hypothetical protein [Asgard group archaeon]
MKIEILFYVISIDREVVISEVNQLKDWKHTRTLILSYRIIFGLLVWITLILMFVKSAMSKADALTGFIAGISSYRYYTMQTNLFAAIWFTLAIIFHWKPDKLNKIKGVLRGAITIYITITFVVFAIVLSSMYQPDNPFDIYTNIAIHYVIPMAFLIDWMFTEKTVNYKWLNLVFWTIYPILYLILTIVHGKLTSDYLYPFLDIDEMGIGKYILAVVILLAGFLLFGSLLIVLNRLWNKRINLEILEDSTENDLVIEEVDQS